MSPDLSVIVPTYGNQLGVEALLRALAGQQASGIAFEVLVVHNEPQLPTSLAAIPDGIDVQFLHEPRRGSYAARNRGVRSARGAILAFVDDDCLPDPGWVAAGVRAVRATARPVGGRIGLFVGGRRVSASARFELTFALDQERYVNEGGYAATANLFVDRALFDRIGPFESRLESGGDVEWGRRARMLGEAVVFAGDCVVAHPVRERFADLARKQRRVARGREGIASLGLAHAYAHDQITLGGRARAATWPVVSTLLMLRRARRERRLTSVVDLLRVGTVATLLDLLRRWERARVRRAGITG